MCGVYKSLRYSVFKYLFAASPAQKLPEQKEKYREG